jgi:pantoate--beta-alanine ligase
MRILESIADVRAFVGAERAAGRRVGFVPTMGALHDGHLSLVAAARERADVVIVSIFVNPLQFGPGEDYAAYPRDLEADAALLAGCGVDAVFAPAVDVMYPPGATTKVVPGPLADTLEGASRPGHFAGVCTVVVKLLSIVAPDVACFGEKDFQQLAIVRSVVRDLDIAVEIVGCPIVREADGLALSSRNAYLGSDDRAAAVVLSRGLEAAAALAGAGERSVAVLEAAIRDTIAAEPRAALDYAVVVDADTLAPLEALGTRPARALVAARVGPARLIDNRAIGG